MPIFPTLTKSSVASKNILPQFEPLNVGPLVSVPLYALPLKSFHVVPVPG